MLQTIFVQPIYNCFIFILGLVPGGDVGIAIIVLTIILRAILYPLFTSSMRTQMSMQAIQPELGEINEKYKTDSAERARRTTELFKRHNIHISSIFGATAIQLVVFISLSYAFFRLGLPMIRTDLLYPFVHAPAVVNENFLGFLNLTMSHHIFLALFVAILQYFVIYLSLARTSGNIDHLPPEQRAAQQMQRRTMLYMFPVVMAVAAYVPPGGVGLYLATGNLFSLMQEWLIRRKPL